MAEKALILSGGGGRGAYQAGVYRHLEEIGWRPDVVCGTSVGAINGAGIVSGMSAIALENLWMQIDARRVMRIRWWRKLKNWILRRGMQSVFDTDPLRSFLEEHLSPSSIKLSEIELFLAAIEIRSSQLHYFTGKKLTIDHVLASASIPILFPWVEIDGGHYWDGGLMANTPLFPALQRGCTDIIVVLLSPVGGQNLELPRNRLQAFERVIEQSLIGSFYHSLLQIPEAQKLGGQGMPSQMPYLPTDWLTNLWQKISQSATKIRIVAPSSSLKLQSMMTFQPKQSRMLLDMGYKDAKQVILKK